MSQETGQYSLIFFWLPIFFFIIIIIPGICINLNCCDNIFILNFYTLFSGLVYLILTAELKQNVFLKKNHFIWPWLCCCQRSHVWIVSSLWEMDKVWVCLLYICLNNGTFSPLGFHVCLFFLFILGTKWFFHFSQLQSEVLLIFLFFCCQSPQL